MAHYKELSFLDLQTGVEYDQDHAPGKLAPFSGIYRCTGCKKEIASNQHEPLPSQNRHQHGLFEGQIKWQLVVKARH